AVRKEGLVLKQADPLGSDLVSDYLGPFLTPSAARIRDVLNRRLSRRYSLEFVCRELFVEWARSVARLCIGLRRFGTGGAFLLSPRPRTASLEIHNGLAYRRVSAAVILGVLEKLNAYGLDSRVIDESGNAIEKGLVIEMGLADEDADDREKELTGAVKVVTSLGAMDGLVLLDPLLTLKGFGVKIKA